MSSHLSEAISNVESATGLRVIHPENSLDIDNLLDAGLVDLYIEAFSKPPYNESFTPEQVRDIFHEGLNTRGIIFAALDDTGKPVAVVMSTPVAAERDIVSIVGHKINVSGTAYFAEDIVDESYRRRGISSFMKSLLLQACHLSGYSHVLLRTTGNNYKQISAVSKAGGFTLRDEFQYVAQQRQDGKTGLDKRGFYMFACDPELESSTPTKLDDVAFVRPGGNDTALVFDLIRRELQPEIGTRIQMTYPNIEQVMFVEKGDVLEYRGQMAGGEFCGNATRAYAYLMAKGAEGTFDVEVSGSKDMLPVDVTKTSSRARMPIFSDFNSVKLIEKGMHRVDLQGISYIVLDQNHPLAKKIMEMPNDEDKKKEAKNILDIYGLSDGPASGVIISRQVGKNIAIEPFVYVRDAGTLYYETGCGSGSTAAALVLSNQIGQSIDCVPILQPSGMSLILDIERTDGEFKSAFVGGEVEVLYRGPINLSREFVPPAPKPKNALEHEKK